MIYVYHYEVAAVVLNIVLAFVFFMRRSYITKSNTLFLRMLVCSAGVAFFDIISSITISFPHEYPLWFNYFVSLGYVCCFNSMPALYLLYTDSLAKIPSIENKIRNIATVTLIIEMAVIITSPWHRLIVYFDENLNYCHGALYPVLYPLAFIMVATAIAIFIKGRVRFNSYQKVAFASFAFCVMGCVVFQLIFPNILLGAFGVSIILFFLYMAFENPAFYFYRDTKCLNREAYTATIKKAIRNGEKISIVGVYYANRAYIKETMGRTTVNNISRSIAAAIHQEFGKRSFQIGDDYSAIVITGDEADNYRDYLKRMHSILDRDSYETGDSVVSLKPVFATIPPEFVPENADELEDVISMMLHEKEYTECPDLPRAKKLAEIRNRRSLISHMLDEAVENEGFKVVYQPIYNLKKGLFESAEALVRLKDESHGFISPDEFIPIAEAEGQIIKLGDIVLKKVCTFLRDNDYKKLGIKYIELNISPKQSVNNGIVDNVKALMQKYQVPPEALNLEITETAEVTDEKQIQKNIIRISESGVGFSIDDFGSGFASMDYLFKLPVDIVKIDKGILWQAMKDNNAMIVLESTIAMVKRLGKKILVEGVEDQKMVDILTALDCDYLQGYFYSKPIPEDEYIEFLKQHNFKA